VLGLDALERANEEVVTPLVGTEFQDAEAWGNNILGLIDLLTTLVENSSVRRLLILSGDVHYGFSVEGGFTLNGRTLSIAQLTSSAMRNASAKLKLLVSLISAFNPPERYVGRLQS
jgi:hypothetical protein